MAAMATAMVVYLSLNAVLMTYASWAEIHAGSFPFKRQEWLRYLLPSSFATDATTSVFLTGPSAVRENLLDEDFRNAFPGSHVFQGALSLGTLNDLLLGLDYIERNFGTDSLPDLMIMGMTPRFIAEIPDERPFAEALDIYGTSGAAHEGRELYPRQKGPWDLIKSRFRWLRKQRARYAVALAAGLRKLLPEGKPYEAYASDFEGIRSFARLSDLEMDALPEAKEFVTRVGLATALARSLHVYISPYRYHALEAPARDGMLRWASSANSFWSSATAWDPTRDGAHSRRSLARLRDFAASRRIRMMLVDLPQNPLIIPSYDPAAYDAYLEMVREELPGVPLFELREMLQDEDFHDLIHLRLPAASRLSRVVIDLVNRELEAASSPTLGELYRGDPAPGTSQPPSTPGDESI